jgi:hypothetical protein
VTVPNYLQPSFNFLETPLVADVANTITRIKTRALLLGWTNPVGDTIVSPANLVGQQITLAFSRIAATNLQMVFTDSLGRTFTRRCQTPASFTERLYLNTFGFFFDPGNGEGLWASLLDLTPDLQNSHDQFSTGYGTRTSGDVVDVTMSSHAAMQLSSASPRVYTPIAVTTWFPRGGLECAGSQRYSQALSRMWYPVVHCGPVVGTTIRIRGRVFQALMVPNSETPQTEITVPLDQATTGTFKVTSWTSTANGLYFMALRKA